MCLLRDGQLKSDYNRPTQLSQNSTNPQLTHSYSWKSGTLKDFFQIRKQSHMSVCNMSACNMSVSHMSVCQESVLEQPMLRLKESVFRMIASLLLSGGSCSTTSLGSTLQLYSTSTLCSHSHPPPP